VEIQEVAYSTAYKLSIIYAKTSNQGIEGSFDISAGALFLQFGETAQQDNLRAGIQNHYQADERHTNDEQCLSTQCHVFALHGSPQRLPQHFRIAVAHLGVVVPER
jgi:hypothetical protein